METEFCASAPSDWSVRMMESVCLRVTSGGTPSRRNPKFYIEGVWPWVKTQELQDCWISDTEEHITEEAVNSSSAKVLPSDTVLIAMYGATVGQLGLLRRPMTCNQASCALIVDPSKADFRFVFYQLLQAREQLKGMAVGAAQQNLSGQLIRALKFPFPPIEEQRTIAHILGTLDDKIELNRRMNQTLEAMARTLFKSWFVDFDGIPAEDMQESELGLIPKGWRVGSVYEIADVRYGAPFASSKFNTEGDGLPLVRIRDLRDERPGVWTPEIHPKGYVIQPGNIIVGMDGEFRAYLWGGQPAWMNQRVCAFHPKKPHCAAFVREAIAPHLAYIEATQVATTVIHLGKGDIDRFRVIVPPDDVAGKFEATCQPIYSKIVTVKQQSQSLIHLRDTLLPKLISGELRVKETEQLLRRLP